MVFREMLKFGCAVFRVRVNNRKARVVRRVSKKEASVKNGRSRNQEDNGLHKPFIGIPVIMAKGSHLFPYRTQKLSLSAPMVLGWRRPGRVGHCRIPNEKAQQMLGFFFLRIRKKMRENRRNAETISPNAGMNGLTAGSIQG